VGPGDYDCKIKNQVIKLKKRKVSNKERTAPFSTLCRRFNNKMPENFPGPGTYENKLAVILLFLDKLRRKIKRQKKKTI
jgi:hypothetical protein